MSNETKQILDEIAQLSADIQALCAFTNSQLCIECGSPCEGAICERCLEERRAK